MDESQCLLITEPPTCPHCGAIARPNILMFGEWVWLRARPAIQGAALKKWRSKVQRPVVIEIGAGTDIPTVRRFSESLVKNHDARLIRINPRESEVSHAGDVALASSALNGLIKIMAILGRVSKT